MSNVLFADTKIKQFIEPSLDRLLFVLAVIAFLLMSPFFVWNHQLAVFRFAHIIGDLILIYIFVKYHNFSIYNISLVILFLVLSAYLMVGGTEYSKITYIPLLALFLIILKPVEQARILDILITILAFFYVVGLISYFLNLAGINKSFGYAFAPNIKKEPYLIFFGHIEETNLRVYRFCSVFDEAGVVGTTNGLILASLGISKNNIRSIIILLAGLISFSLAFYIMLAVIIISQFNIRNIVIASIFGLGVILFAGERFDNLIAQRLTIEDGQLSGDNRTAEEFEAYYSNFLSKGGKDLIFGKGTGFFQGTKEEHWSESSFKTRIIDWGIIGVVLVLTFYVISTIILNNSAKGWLLSFIFLLSAYQRPDLTSYTIIVMYLGGLNYLKSNSTIVPISNKSDKINFKRTRIEFSKL